MFIKKIILLILCQFLITGCIHPRFDWGNAEYKGYITDVSGKPIQKALVIVKNKTYLSDTVQITETDVNGFYEIKPKKIFFVVGAVLALPPQCIDKLYVTHPLYDTYFQRQLNGRKYFHRICTDMSFIKNVVLKEKIKRPNDFETPSWQNVKNGVKVYDFNEQENGEVINVNEDKKIITIEFDDGVSQEKSQESKTLEEVKSKWLIKSK